MTKTLERASPQVLREAIEARDGRRLGALYAKEAELVVIDRNNPPSLAQAWDE